MWIETRPASAGIHLEARAPSNGRPVPTTEVVVLFELLPTHERDHLDLDTGEVFQDYNYAKVRGKEQKLIEASITIREVPDDSYYQQNVMHYMAEIKSDDSYRPSSIYFQVFIEPTALRELADNIRGGLVPETITIEIDDALNKETPLQYGWEPDGSGKIWHNTEKENQKVPIESVKFRYAVVKPRYDEEQVGRLLPMQPSAPTDRKNEQIALIQTILAEMSKRLRFATMGIVALVIMIGILIAQRIHF